MKIIPLAHCGSSCPNWTPATSRYSDRPDIAYCKATERLIPKELPVSNFPSWCPLEDLVKKEG